MILVTVTACPVPGVLNVAPHSSHDNGLYIVTDLKDNKFETARIVLDSKTHLSSRQCGRLVLLFFQGEKFISMELA